MTSEKFKIVRFYQNGDRRTIKSGVSLEDARAHCHNPETSSRTATSPAAHKRTRHHGPWSDGYQRIGR